MPLGKIATRYLPPELQRDESVGYQPPGDVYCVGMLVSELMTDLSLSDDVATWVARVTCSDQSAHPSAKSLLLETSGCLFA